MVYADTEHRPILEWNRVFGNPRAREKICHISQRQNQMNRMK